MLVIVGGATYLLGDRMEVPVSTPIAWATLVPVDPPTDPTAWPRERSVQIVCETVVGTVDELVEDYRKKLTLAFGAMTCGGNVIPTLGEASLRKQSEVLTRHNLAGPGVQNVWRATPDQAEVPERERAKLTGLANRQEARMRASLMQLVALYFSPGGLCVRDPETGDWAKRLSPTDHPKRVQALIDALTVLKEDRERQDGRSATKAVFENGFTRDTVYEAVKVFEAQFGRKPVRIWLTQDMLDRAAAWGGTAPYMLPGGRICDMVVEAGETYAMA
jgi:hypothetical protein